MVLSKKKERKRKKKLHGVMGYKDACGTIVLVILHIFF
jgi:hypothetical protein